MFNPFAPFTDPLLQAFVQRGKTYFVRQTFWRAPEAGNGNIKGAFLLSHYDSLTTAQDHYGAIGYDPNRFLYDYSKEEHQRRLHIAATSTEYRVYACVFRKDWEQRLPPSMGKRVRLYLASLGWQPKGSDQVDTRFEVHFGELFIHLKLGRRQAKIKFEQIEKIY